VTEARRGAGERPLLTDTHVHLDLRDYDRDRREVIERALDAGVGYMLNVGFDIATSLASVELAETHDFIRASVGVHPHGASESDDDLLRRIEELAGRDRVVAIGETGLDYYRDLSPREDQQRSFRRHIRMARELDLPLVVHNREALEDVMSILEDEGGGEVRGVMHCFSGSAETAKICVGMGLYVSFTGTVTFKNARKVVDAAAAVPLDRLMAETDCPYLSPEPVRGKRNDPGNVKYVIEKLADIHGVSADEMAETNIRNAKELYGI